MSFHRLAIAKQFQANRTGELCAILNATIICNDEITLKEITTIAHSFASEVSQMMRRIGS